MAFWQANHGACSNPGTQLVTQNKEFGAGTHANLTRADVWETQRAKKVVSDGPGLVDFAIGASDFCS